MNEMLQTESGGALGWSAWLGGIDVVRIILLGGMWLCLMLSARSLISVVAQIRREKKECGGQPHDGPGQTNKLLGLPLHLVRCLCLLVRNYRHQLGRQPNLNGNLPLIALRLHLRKYFRNSRIHNGALPPNDKSAANRPGDDENRTPKTQ